MHQRKTKIGLFLICSPRFSKLGEGTKKGTYGQRKELETEMILPKLKESCDVVYPGLIYEREDVNKAIDTFYKEKVDMVLAVYMSWAEDFHWIRFLRDMPQVPILFAHMVRDSLELKDTHDEDEFIEFLSAGGLVGTHEASGSIKRVNRPMVETMAGTLDEIVETAKVFGTAAKVKNILKQSKVGLLSSYNEVMWSTYVSPYDIFTKVGPEIHFLSVYELVNEIDNISDCDLKAACDALTSKYTMREDVDYVKFQASVKASMAMERLSQKNDIDLLVLNDLEKQLFEMVGLRPGFYPCPGEYPVTIVPEGDIGGGLAVYIQKLISGKKANFIEPFHIYHDKNVFAAGHAGPNDYTAAGSKVIIARDVRFAKTNYKYAGAPFAWTVFSEGRKTMTHISQCTSDSSFKIVTTQVEALPTNHYLATYSHADFVPLNGTCEELFGKAIDIGVTQHYSIVDGDYTKELEYLSKLMGFEYHNI